MAGGGRAGPPEQRSPPTTAPCQVHYDSSPGLPCHRLLRGRPGPSTLPGQQVGRPVPQAASSLRPCPRRCCVDCSRRLDTQTGPRTRCFVRSPLASGSVSVRRCVFLKQQSPVSTVDFNP